MLKVFLLSVLMFVAMLCFGQSTQTRFFRDRGLKKEVSERRARYSQTSITRADGTTTTEVKDLEHNQVILRNGEPFGTWESTRFREKIPLNYDFNLTYNHKKCSDSIDGFSGIDYFHPNDRPRYTPPAIATGESSITQFLENNLCYPQQARNAGTQGVVYLRMVVTDTGVIDELAIYEAENVVLAKEAMRVMRELKIASPAKLRGKPVGFCMVMPIRFVLKD